MLCRRMLAAALLTLVLIVSYQVASATPCPALPVLNWEPRSDWISVKDHGAVGDGKADDTEAIQAILSQVKRGMTIYFPPGTYRLTRTVNLLNANPRRTAKPTGSPGDPIDLIGVTLIGHGRESRLVWDGHDGDSLLQTEGMTFSRIVGLDFDGGGRASVGLYWCSKYTFGTSNRVQHCGFRNFNRTGVYFEPRMPPRRFADAETSFENCLFLGCGTGVSFTWFNDFNYTFDGCEFRQCGTGIRCTHGNFYARDCHFEESRDTDIESAPELGCSVRRCTSLNSQCFVNHDNSVAPMTIEDCRIAGWKSPGGAIRLSGAPCMVFDCVFSDPSPGAGAPVYRNGGELILSGNSVKGDANPSWPKSAKFIPTGQRSGVLISADQSFFKSVVRIPGKVFDAKMDFGAKGGDGRYDDTDAIQKAIDAARQHGQGAIAYLPAGNYTVSKPLSVTGKDYFVGGAGILLATNIKWRGPKGEAAMLVESPDYVTIENMEISNHENSPVEGADILLTSAGAESFVTFDGVSFSKTNKDPFSGGLCCRGLNEKATVLLSCATGTLRFTDCARATILVPLSYYGALIVEGKEKQRDGFLGIMSRFSNGTRNVIVQDNNSLVMSDYFSENSANIFRFEGSPDDPPGRITIQQPKSHLQLTGMGDLTGIPVYVFDIANYSGQIFYGPGQFFFENSKCLYQRGERPVELFIMASAFYGPLLAVDKTDVAQVYLLDCAGIKLNKDMPRGMFSDSMPPEKLPELSKALDDLRRLGEMDLKLNHGKPLPEQR